jgi:hypothetical protein
VLVVVVSLWAYIPIPKFKSLIPIPYFLFLSEAISYVSKTLGPESLVSKMINCGKIDELAAKAR